MSNFDVLTVVKREKEKEKENKNNSFDVLDRVEADRSQMKIAEIYSRLDSLTSARNNIYKRYNSRFIDKDGKYINAYRGDTSDALATFESSKIGLDNESKSILEELSKYEKYLDGDSVKEIKDYLSSYSGDLDSMYKTYQNDHSYFSQWADEDAYNRDYDHYTYSNKYKGKTYADLMNEKELVKRKATKATGDDLDALNRELYWLENHSTDRQFADTMTTEELRAMKDKYEENEAKKLEHLALQKAMGEAQQMDGTGDFVSNALNLIADDWVQTADEKKQEAINDYARQLAELGYDDSITNVLYSDENGIAYTIQDLLRIREAEGTFSKINSDVNAKSAYDKAFEASEENKALVRRTAELTEKMKEYGEGNPAYDALSRELQGLTDKINKNKDIIANFDALGYSFDDLDYYNDWKESRKNYAQNKEENEKYAKEHPILATGKSILNAPMSIAEYGANLLDSSKYGYANVLDDEYSMRNETYQGTVSTMIGDEVYEATGSEIASWLASTAYSGVTSAASSGMTALACTALFGGAGGKIASVILGAESASSAYRSAIMNGSTNGEALTYSVASGVAEAIFEYVSLDKLASNVLKAGWNTESLSAFFKSALKNTGKVFGQGLVEASEEFATELSNKVADAIINGDTSAYETAVRKYKSQGYSDMDAKELAQKDFVVDIVNASVGGFFGGIGSGGVVNTFNMGLAGASTASNAQFYKQQGQNIIENDGVGELVGQAATLMNGSKALQSLADEVAGVKEKDAQKNKHARNVGRLQSAVQKAQLEGVAHADRVAFKTMVKGELKAKGMTHTDTTAKIFEKVLKAEELTDIEKQVYENVGGAEILKKVLNAKTSNKAFNKKMESAEFDLTGTQSLVVAKYMDANQKKYLDDNGIEYSTDGKTIVEATDKEVKVGKVTSVDKGNIKVEVTDNENTEDMDVGELRLDQDTALYIEAVSEMSRVFSIDVDVANELFDILKTPSTVNPFIKFLGVRQAFTYGMTHRSVDALNEGDFANRLPQDVKEKAYNLAKGYKEKTAKAKQSKKKANPTKQSEVSFADDIELKSLTEEQEVQMLIATMFSEAMGNDLHFFKSKKGEQGEALITEKKGSWAVGRNKMSIDIDTGLVEAIYEHGVSMGVARGLSEILITLSHENVHQFADKHPELFNKYVDALFEVYGKLEGVESLDVLIGAEAERFGGNRDKAIEELAARMSENFLKDILKGDTRYLEAFAEMQKRDATLVDRVKAFLKSMAEKIKAVLDRLTDSTSEEAKAIQKANKEDLARLHDMYKALLEACAVESESLDGDNSFTEAEESAYLDSKNILNHDRFVNAHMDLIEQKFDYDNAAIEISELVKRYEAIVDIWREIGGELNSKFLNDWNNQEYKDRAFTVFKAQQGYKYNAELSSMCKKGIPLFEAIDTIVKKEVMKKLNSKVIGKAEKEILYDILKAKGFEIPCAICYVEQARQREGVIIEAFVNGKVETDNKGNVKKVKLGWNEVLDKVETKMKELGVEYKFDNVDRSIATEKYSPKSIEMDVKTQEAFYEALRLVANEEIERYNRDEKPKNPKKTLKDSSPETVNSVFKGNPPANLKIFKTLFNDKNSRFKLDTDLLYSSMTTKNLAVAHKMLYTLFNSQGGVSGYKTKQGTVVYLGDFLKKTWTSAQTRKEGGIRNQSNSDFMMYTLLDQVQIYVDLSAKGYYLHAYTKVLAELKLFGLSNAKINASLIPAVHIFKNADGSVNVKKTKDNAGLDENGNPIYDDFEGINHEEAFMLLSDADYSKSVSGICIGYSDAHIMKLLDDNKVQLIIGFHDKTDDADKRYRGARYAKNYNGLNEAVKVKADGTTETVHIGFNQFVIKAEKMFKQNDNGDFEGIAKHNDNTYVADDIPRLATDLYLEHCKKKNLIPAYHIEIGEDTNGNKIYMSDHPNYYKLLGDFGLKNSEGHYAPHKKVQFNMPDSVPYLEDGVKKTMPTKDYIKAELEKEMIVRDDIASALEDNTPDGIIPQFVKKVNELHDAQEMRQDRDSEGRELTPEQAEFFKDSKVRDENGNLLKVYHGTDAEFNVFEKRKGTRSIGILANYEVETRGFFFSADYDFANQYGKNIKPYYLNVKKPLLKDTDRVNLNNIDNKGNTTFYDEERIDELYYILEPVMKDVLSYEYEYTYNFYKDDVDSDKLIKRWALKDLWEYFDGDIFRDMSLAWEVIDKPVFDECISRMIELGYDGFMVNEGEDNPNSWFVLNSNQAKLTTNLNPTEDEDIRYQDRVTPEEDAEYLELAKNPEKNEARLREMVDSVASKYGYTDRVYHGTTGFGFTKIDLHESDDGMSFFATDSVEVAGTYSSTDTAKRIAEVSNSVEVDNEKIIDDIYNMASNFADYCNRTLGVQDWVDLDYFKTKIQDCLDDYNNGSSMDDVAGEFYAFCDEVFYSFVDYYNYTYYTKKGLNKETIEKPTEVKKISDTFYDYVGNIIKEFQELKSKDRGIYDLFANTNGLFEIDGQGKRWNQIPFDQYDKNGFYPTVNTRQVARYAKSEGYKGAKISNIFDDGGKGAKRQGKPSTIYIFFNPQEQVKSADLVTYDDEGNIIPLSERFNEADEDIRYMSRSAAKVSQKFIDDTTASFGITDIDDYIHVQRKVMATLLKENFFTDNESRSRTDTNIKSGMVIVTNRSGIKETFNKDNYKKLGKVKRALKLATIRKLPEIIKNGKLIANDVENYHKKNSGIHFAYIESVINVDGLDVSVKIDIKKSPQKNKFWVHSVQILEKANEQPAVASRAIKQDNGSSAYESSVPNSTENVNIQNLQDDELHQDRPQQITLEELGIDHKAENEKLKTDIERLKDLLKFQKTLTHGTAFSKTSVNSAASILMKKFGMHRGKDELAKMLNEYYKFIATGDEIAWQSVIGKAEEIAKWVDSQIVRKTETDEHSKEILSYIRALRIKLDDTQKGEVAYRYGSYEAFRRANMGSIILTDKGTELDSIWQDLAERYPDVFDVNENAADMPIKLVETIADLRTADKLLEQVDKNDELRWMAEEIYDSYWNVSTIHSLADRQQREVNILKSKHRQQMDELREKHKSQMDDEKAHYQDMLKRVRADRDEKMKAYKEKVQEQRHRNVEGRNKTALKNKIKRVIKELNSILNNGTKERNVKFELQETVDKALEMAGYLTTNFTNEEVLVADTMVTLTAEEKKLVNKYKKLVAQRNTYIGRINEQQKLSEFNNYKLIDDLNAMVTSTNKEIKKLEKKLSGVVERNRAKLNDDLVSEAIQSLASAYRKLNESQDAFVKGAYSDHIYNRITALEDSLKGTKMNDMSLAQLQEMYDVYKMVMATVRVSNQLFVDGKREDVNKAVSNVLLELDSRHKAKMLPNEKLDKALDVIRDFSYKELKPVYFFERLGSKTLKQIFFDEARKGEDVFARDIEHAQRFIQDEKEKHGYSSWDMEKGHDIELSSGRTIKLSLSEIMSIYAYSKRDQALDHMSNGGFVFNTKEYFDTDKKGKKTVRQRGGTPYRVNAIDLVKIKTLLTDEQITFVDEMQDYLSTVMGRKGNEVSRILYGIDLFKEKYYFPLVSSEDFIARTNEPVGEITLKNTGMAKAILPYAKNPIVLQGFEEVWASHVGNMSTYHALVLPIENMNKVLNYAEYIGADVDSVSVKGVIGDIFTKSATDYISNYIRDLNGGVTTQGATGLFTKLFTNFKKTAVSASLSTVVQQPTAIFRAMAMVNPKYFVGLEKGNYEEIKKYAPIAIIKEMGGFDAGNGKSATNYLLETTYKGGKEKLKAFFTDADYRDSIFMWGAEKGDELGWNIIWSAVKKEVSATTTYAEGSEEFLQECGKRFTEVISYTQVYDSTFSRSEYMRSKNDIEKMATAFMGEPTTSFNMLYNAVLQNKRGEMSKGKLMGVVGAVVSSIIMATVAKSFIYALRDDDEDESYLYKYTESLFDSLKDDLFVPNMLPFVKDVTSLFSGWDVERTDMAIFKDLKDAIDGLFSDTKSPYRKVEDLAGAIAALAGVPLKNVMRTFREGYNLVANIADDNTGYEGDTPSASEVNKLLEKGKNDKAKDTISEILKDKAEKYESEGYTTQEANKKAKSALKSSITSYWKELYIEAYRNKDNAEMLRIRKALQATGLYDNVVETCQEWIKNSKNQKDTDATWTGEKW